MLGRVTDSDGEVNVLIGQCKTTQLCIYIYKYSDTVGLPD